MKYNRLMISIASLCMLLVMGLCTMNVYGENQEVDSRWSRMAIVEVKKQFGKNELTDFEHVQSVTLENEQTKEVFKVQVNPEQDRPFIVYVEITYETKTKQVQTIELKKKS